MDRLWDFFVDSMMVFFLPLVCSYHAITGDLFLNVSAQDATGLEQAANLLLSPVQYIFAGRKAIQKPDGSWELIQRFDYKTAFWKNTALSAVALPSSLILGSAVKGLSFLTEKTRKRYASLKSSLYSKEVRSNLSAYRQMGLDIRDASEAAFFSSQGHLRGPGEENILSIEKKALSQIGALLTEAKIPWWVDCGTCLGAYRYGGVIPWDADIDVAVLVPDFDNVRHVLNQLDPQKYIVQDWSSREAPKSYFKVFIRESGTLIDVYHFEILPETREIRYILSLESNFFFPEWWKIRERRFKAPVSFDVVFPLKKALLDGVEVFLPADPEKYLQRCYGENLSPAKIYDPKTGRYEKDLTHPYWQRAYVH